MNKVSAAVKLIAPGQSRPLACGSRDSVALAQTSPKPATPISAVARNTQRQPAISTNPPAASGPKAKPMPNVVPSRLNTRVRIEPRKVCASEDMAPAKAVAPPRP
ncbi:hypothetical protein D3C71_1686920 [compost metagenome]